MLSLQYMIFSQCEQNASLFLLENMAFFAKMEIIWIEKSPTEVFLFQIISRVLRTSGIGM